ncbi:MAG TPA: alpha-amylase family glycosyl hydrolase, partial [Trueperaceae bacterium]
MTRRAVALAAVGLLLTGAVARSQPVSVATPAVTSELPPPEEIVWYEVFVRSFQDSDGDGVGDLDGVTSRLDYLSELGIGGLWLMPIYPSPSYHGYDVTDLTAVNPDYGTLADFEQLLAAAHARGMRVILDFIPNHTSDRHAWFQAALAGDTEYRDFYVWSDDPPDWRGALGGPAWHAGGGSHYLGLFSPSMPDLNHRNERVVEEVLGAAAFWLKLGADGFRVDAIQHVVESADGITANAPENYAWVERFQRFVREVAPSAVVMGETQSDMPAIVRYHRDAGLHMSLDYPLWRDLRAAILARSASDLAVTLEQQASLYPEGAARATFTGNHDVTRLASELSIPRRDERRIRLAASLLLTLPGTPFIYYGEEIGMPDGPGSRDVEKRTPMRWEPGPGVGFSTATPWTDTGPDLPGVSVHEQAT